MGRRVIITRWFILKERIQARAAMRNDAEEAVFALCGEEAVGDEGSAQARPKKRQATAFFVPPKKRQVSGKEPTHAPRKEKEARPPAAASQPTRAANARGECAAVLGRMRAELDAQEMDDAGGGEGRLLLVPGGADAAAGTPCAAIVAGAGAGTGPDAEAVAVVPARNKGGRPLKKDEDLKYPSRPKKPKTAAVVQVPSNDGDAQLVAFADATGSVPQS